MSTDLLQVNFRYTAQADAIINTAPLSINTTAPQFTNPSQDFGSNQKLATTIIPGLGTQGVNAFQFYRLNFNATSYFYNLPFCGSGCVAVIPDDPVFATLTSGITVYEIAIDRYLAAITPKAFPVLTQSVGGALSASIPKMFRVFATITDLITPAAQPVPFNVTVVCF